MRKISYYIIVIVLIGIAISSLWVYQRYFKAQDQSFLYFKVDRGDIQESLKVRSEVVAQKEFELEFPFSGTIESIAVQGGAAVTKGQRLMKLETKDFEIQSRELEAVVAERKASLAKVKAGAAAEDIHVASAKLASAKVALAEAQKGVSDALKDAYAKSDDAVRGKTDQLFDNPRGANPSLNVTVSDSSAKSTINAQRQAIEILLNTWSTDIANMSASDLSQNSVTTAQRNMATITAFLNTLAPVVSSLTPSANLTQTTIDAYNASVSAARASMSTSITALSTADEKRTLAESNVTLAENQLAQASAPARAEDIAIAETRVSEVESQLEAVREKIRKSVLYAPSSGKVSKVHYEVGEVFRPGQPAISLTTTGYKLQADISELDISKVRESNGNAVRVMLDAYPGQVFDGKVLSIDSKEVVKTEDKYYRVNIAFDAPGVAVRTGMSADAVILSTLKKDIVRVPELAVYTDGKEKYLKVLLPGLTKAVSNVSFAKSNVVTGITDGESVEIVSGVEPGRTAVVTAE